MSDSRTSTLPEGPERIDPVVADLVAGLIDRMEHGEDIDLEALDHHHAEEVRRLLSTVKMVSVAAPPAPRDADLGTLGEYKLLREVGRGGMGTVYEAVHVAIGKRAAVKELPGTAALDPRYVRRFQTEAQAAARLEHPGIVPVFDVGEDRGRHFYAMQFIEGLDLAKKVKDWKKETASTTVATLDRMRAAAEYVRQAAEALAHAHDHAIIHRDVKPSNLLVDRHDRVWVADFGLALIEGEPGLSGTGARVGTLSYMSPEQIQGGRASVDRQTDVYALGATLYELLTLRRAFEDQDEVVLLRKIAHEGPAPPRRVDPRIPLDLETIVLRAMEREKRHRTHTAADMAEDLRRFLDDRPLKWAKRPTMRERAGKWARRNRAVVSVGAVAALAVLAVVIATGVGTITLLQRHNLALGKEVNLNKRYLLVSELKRVWQFIDSGENDLARDLLDSIASDQGIHVTQEFAWNYLKRLVGEEFVEIQPETRGLTHLFPSPDKRTVVVGTLEGRVEVWDLVTRSLRADLTGTAIKATRPQFSPDGRLVVACEYWGTDDPRSHLGAGFDAFQAALVWDMTTGRLLASLPIQGEGRWIRHAWFVNDSILYVCETCEIYTNIKDMHYLWKLGPGLSQPRCVAILTDEDHARAFPGRFPLVRRKDKNQEDRLWLTDPESGKPYKALNNLIGVVGAPSGWLEAGEPVDEHSWTWSKDGTTLAGAFRDGRVQTWDVPTGRRDRFRTYTGALDHLVFAPDGSRLAAWNGETGGVYIFAREPLSGPGANGILRSPTLQVDGPGVPPHGVQMAFSRDGRSLAVCNTAERSQAARISVWDVATGTRVDECPSRHTVDGVEAMSYTLDGRFLMWLGNRTIKLWSRTTRSWTTSLGGHKDEAWAVDFSPNGDLLASGSDDTTDTQTIKLWDPKTGRLVNGWHGGPGLVSSLAFSPDGRTLASTHLDASGSVRLWDVDTVEPLDPLKGHTSTTRSVAFHPNGLRLATCSTGKTARIWDVASRQCLLVLKGNQDAVQEVAFSPDGSTLASAGDDGTVRLWEAATGKLVLTFEGDKGFMTVKFSPDGAILAAADQAGLVWTWDPRSGKPIGVPWKSHGDQLLALAFTPDGKTLAVAGMRGLVDLWDVVTGQELFKLQKEGPQVNGLAFSPDGSTLAAASHDGSVRLWQGGPRAAP
jgi:WD40 repeat protein/serine/threonine protein kinase